MLCTLLAWLVDQCGSTQPCQTLLINDLNTSDHLSIVASNKCSICMSPAGCIETKYDIVVDWEGSRRLSLLDSYACKCGEVLQH